jgi:hypothetical protein
MPDTAACSFCATPFPFAANSTAAASTTDSAVASAGGPSKATRSSASTVETRLRLLSRVFTRRSPGGGLFFAAKSAG